MAARIGLTGGIGSGKSTIAQLFSTLGVLIIDADDIAREVVLRDSEGLKLISKRYGNKVLLQNGMLDRKALSTIIFSDHREREWIEELLHPMIRERMDSMAATCANPYCILEVPLLIETNREVDQIIVVHCPREIRIARLISSRKMSREEILQVMDVQVSDEMRLELADFVIDNVGIEGTLISQVHTLHNALTSMYLT